VPGLVYASQVYPEGPAALCLAVAALCALRPGSGPVRSQTVALVGSVVALEWLGVKYLPYAVLVVGIWAWRHRSHRGHLAAATAVFAIAGGHYDWWHLHTFGGLTPYGTNVVWAGEGTSSILVDHLDMPDRTYRLYGLFLDARFGLLRWLPVAILALLGIQRRTWSHAANVAIGVALGTFVSITIMGYWFPGRMLVAAFPSLTVLVALGAARLPRTAPVRAAWGWAVAVAVAIAARTRVIRLAVDPWIVGFPLAPAALFPDFRRFTAEEVAKSLAWALVAAVTVTVARSGRRARA
jgi:hypothetical protein